MELDRRESVPSSAVRLRGLLAGAVIASLASCEAWERNVAFWNSPQGHAINMQAFQHQQMLNQQSYEFEQNRLLQLQQMHAETARSMQPIKVQHSGSIDVRHSGTIRVRR